MAKSIIRRRRNSSSRINQLTLIFILIMSVSIAQACSTLALSNQRAFADDSLALRTASLYTQSSGTSLENAATITLDKSVSGKLGSYTDEHWYRIKLSNAGLFEATLQSAYSKSRGLWVVRLKDSQNRELCSGLYSTGGLLCQSMWRIGLSAGTYYITVNDPNLPSESALGKTYSLMTHLAVRSDWEKETNDSPEQAGTLGIASKQFGEMRQIVGDCADDEDWYTMALANKQRIKFMIKAEYFNTDEHDSLWTGGDWAVHLYDANLKELASSTSDAKNKTYRTLFTQTLPSGRYYIRISEGSFGMGRSTSHVTYCLNTSIEKERNPMSVKAKTITANSKKTKRFVKSKVFTIKNAKGAVSFKKISGNKKINVNSKTGKVTVKKGLKRAKKYKAIVKVIVAGNSLYKSSSEMVQLKVKVR